MSNCAQLFYLAGEQRFGHGFSPPGDPLDPGSAPVAPAPFSSLLNNAKQPRILIGPTATFRGWGAEIRTPISAFRVRRAAIAPLPIKRTQQFYHFLKNKNLAFRTKLNFVYKPNIKIF